MKQISLPWMFEIMDGLSDLDKIPIGAKLNDVWIDLFMVKSRLEVVFDQSLYSPFLRASRTNAKALHEILGKFTDESDEIDENKILTEGDCWRIKDAREKFKQVFLAELNILPAYLVSQKGTHDTILLIEEGVRLFPQSLLTKAPETKLDALEVGKALAFELGTACGFHTFRVTEAVTKRYWDVVSKGRKRPRLETLGNYAAEMEKRNFGDAKVIESMKQMTKLHRNPTIHPEYILSVDEAIGTVGMAQSVIGAMLNVLPDVPITTTNP